MTGTIKRLTPRCITAPALGETIGRNLASRCRSSGADAVVEASRPAGGPTPSWTRTPTRSPGPDRLGIGAGERPALVPNCAEWCYSSSDRQGRHRSVNIKPRLPAVRTGVRAAPILASSTLLVLRLQDQDYRGHDRKRFVAAWES